MALVRKAFVTLKDKKELELCTKEGIPVREIAEHFGVTVGVVYRELKNGLTEEEYKSRRYVKYKADKSFELSLKELYGE